MLIQGEEPLEEDLEWLKYGRQMIQESPKVLDEAAKSFLTLASTLLTAYTGALALFKFNEKATDLLAWAVISTPIILWLLCISCLAYVYFPDRLRFRKNSPTDIENVTRSVSRKKSERLKVGSMLFVIALAATSISIVWLGAGPDDENTKKAMLFMMAEDEAGMLENLSGLEIESASIVVLSDGNQTYSGNSTIRGG